MDKLPSYSPTPRPNHSRIPVLLAALALTGLSLFAFSSQLLWSDGRSSRLPINAAQILHKCRQLNVKPGPPADFNKRKQSDRFEGGTKPVLLRNATIWTGTTSGLDVVHGDVLLDKGLIKAVGKIDQAFLSRYDNLITQDLHGAWVSPGIFDMHSHLGVDSSPALSGANDGNSRKGLILPWMRSLDGLNTHDDAYPLSISGGVTSALVLPGSADAIGGQAFAIKLRPTAERSPSSMLLEPPYTLNGTEVDPKLAPRWRQMKHACGENPSRVYSGTRMDTIWAFRQGYDTARKIKESQDKYCSKALAGSWEDLGDFPEELQWEALVDVLRGRVKIHNHCYEAVDLDGIVRLTNEFKFSVAAFHHAHETYLVPDLLKKAYGHPPAIALFATNARYKRESYRGSEFAPRILAENGLKVVMKSDHPVLNSRHLLYEAQQAHYYGLNASLALASVTTTPAIVAGLDHRIGYVKEGYDADIVVWDSHPLALGATPQQVYIDGIPQLQAPHTVGKPPSFQTAPETPNFDKEASDAVKYDGLPPLQPTAEPGTVLFSNVSSVFLRRDHTIRQIFSASDIDVANAAVVVEKGRIICTGSLSACSAGLVDAPMKRIDLAGGSISPGLVTFGSPLGLQEIQGEPSTSDGFALDPLTYKVPSIIGGDAAVIRAVDGLQFSTRDALLAYRAGVTTGIVAPKTRGFLAGLSTAFSTGAAHRLEGGAIVQELAALHVEIGHGGPVPSVSTQIAALRRQLLGHGESDADQELKEAIKAKTPLAVIVHSADIIASLISLKKEVETLTGNTLSMTLVGASEAHLLAKELGEAGIGVILSPVRPFPATWESRRILPGPPLAERGAVATLLAHNVTVGVGVEEAWAARSTRFDLGWVALEAGGDISKAEALSLASVNLEKLLGVEIDAADADIVATKGGSLLDFEAKVVAVVSPLRGVVDLV